MSVDVGELLKLTLSQAPENLFSKDTARHVQRLSESFAGFQTSEVIAETNLNDQAGRADISFRVLAEEAPAMIQAFSSPAFDKMAEDDSWQRLISFCRGWPAEVEEVWIEMDQTAYEQPLPPPCFFYDGSGVHPRRGMYQPLLRPSLLMLLDNPVVGKMENTLLRTLSSLPEEVTVFQMGTMLARHQDRLRLFTTEMSWEQAMTWTKDLQWKGTPPDVASLNNLTKHHSDGRFILDVDVTEEGVNPKLGINFGVTSPENLHAFLENLIKEGLCTQEKKEILLSWKGTRGQFMGKEAGYCALINRISHFKVTQQEGQPLTAKVYLQTLAVSIKKQLEKKRLAREAAERNQEMAKGTAAYRHWNRQAQENMKQLMTKAMLDQDFRNRCLNEGETVFRETFEGEVPTHWQPCFIETDTAKTSETSQKPWEINLPPYLKKTWLNSKSEQ